MFYITGDLNKKSYNDELISFEELKKNLIESGSIEDNFFDEKQIIFPFKVVYEEREGQSNEPSRNVPLKVSLRTKQGDYIEIRYSKQARRKDKNENWDYYQNKYRINTFASVNEKELAFFLMIHPQQLNSPMKGNSSFPVFVFVEPEKEKMARNKTTSEKFKLLTRLQNEPESVIRAKYWAMGLSSGEGQSAESMRQDLMTLADKVGADAFLDKYDSDQNMIAGTIMKGYHFHLLSRADTSANRILVWGDNAPYNLRGNRICSVPAGVEPNQYILQYFIENQETQYQTLLKLTKDKENKSTINLITQQVEENSDQDIVANFQDTLSVVQYAIKKDFIFIDKINNKVYFRKTNDSDYIEMLAYEKGTPTGKIQQLAAEHISKSQEGKNKDKNISNLLGALREIANQQSPATSSK